MTPRSSIWLAAVPLLLVVMFLVAVLVASPKEREGTFVMVQGRGARVTPEQNADFLQNLRDEGCNVPTSMIDEARQRASAALRQQRMTRMLYAMAGVSFVVGVLVFFFTSGFRVAKNRMVWIRHLGHGPLLIFLSLALVCKLCAGCDRGEEPKTEAQASFMPASKLYQVSFPVSPSAVVTSGGLELDRATADEFVQEHSRNGLWTYFYDPDLSNGTVGLDQYRRYFGDKLAMILIKWLPTRASLKSDFEAALQYFQKSTSLIQDSYKITSLGGQVAYSVQYIATQGGRPMYHTYFIVCDGNRTYEIVHLYEGGFDDPDKTVEKLVDLAFQQLRG
ncbi:hypothetical protein [Desulfobacterium sp. N47]|uniref:Uncharacterized protein n=1 Tax=uncultured Desulfobacterium sp. TaxID=201089 RepID=E1YIA5_9BACT|nr:unknown protein [uncultured Desulfobacterium sp.]